MFESEGEKKVSERGGGEGEGQRRRKGEEGRMKN